jgi:membrane protease YdiL (CAAX protease family)
VPWLAAACGRSEFPRYFDRALMLAALVLLVPALRWLRAGRGGRKFRDTPWSLRLPDAAVVLGEGQPLRRNPHGWRQLSVGFLFAAVSLLLLGWGLLHAGVFVWRDAAASAQGVENVMPLEKVRWFKAMKNALPPAVIVAVIEEILFRGVLCGMLLRVLRPVPAMAGLSLMFAFLHFLDPPLGVKVAEPEGATAGLWLLGQIVTRFTEPLPMLAEFSTLVAVGLVLAYARWRTASLWLPIGLHAGWVFGILWFKALTWPVFSFDKTSSVWVGHSLSEGLVPLAVVLVTGVLVHVLTRRDAARISN